jgi:hypothetical protein
MRGVAAMFATGEMMAPAVDWWNTTSDTRCNTTSLEAAELRQIAKDGKEDLDRGLLQPNLDKANEGNYYRYATEITQKKLQSLASASKIAGAANGPRSLPPVICNRHAVADGDGRTTVLPISV